MNKFSTMIRISILTGCFCLAQTTAQAASIAAGEQILNGGFQTAGGAASLASWNTSGTTNARLSTNTINTSGGNAGFNNFFSSAFAVLGDASGAIGNTTGGISTISQAFTLGDTLDSVLIQDYDLYISFSTVFDGQDNATSTSALSDLFFATLSANDGSIPDFVLFSQNSLNFPSGTPSINSPNYQLTNSQFSATILGLLPGDYTLKFTLNERSGGGVNSNTETAAGIDNVSVTAFGNPLPIPEPGTLLLLGIGLAALHRSVAEKRRS